MGDWERCRFSAIQHFGPEEVVVGLFCLYALNLSNCQFVKYYPIFDVIHNTCVVLFLSNFLNHLDDAWVVRVMPMEWLQKFFQFYW